MLLSAFRVISQALNEKLKFVGVCILRFRALDFLQLV